MLHEPIRELHWSSLSHTEESRVLKHVPSTDSTTSADCTVNPSNGPWRVVSWDFSFFSRGSESPYEWWLENLQNISLRGLLDIFLIVCRYLCCKVSLPFPSSTLGMKVTCRSFYSEGGRCSVEIHEGAVVLFLSTEFFSENTVCY